VAWQLPLYVADGPTVPTHLTVATINLKYGLADPQAVVALVREHHVDVLALEELTYGESQALRVEGLDDLLPHSIVRSGLDAGGTGLWSVLPLASTRSIAGYDSALLTGKVTVDGAALTLVAAHPTAPSFPGHAAWSEEYRHLTVELASIPGAVMLLGDLNATRDQAPLRTLEDTGFRDAADQAGAGLRMTYPAWFPVTPLVAIDHTLVRSTDLRATSLQLLDVPGTDHRGLLVTYG
jgi:endonuclease/exonuclease/phosphatase (EEP) superfamily protein YafD